MHHSSFSPQTSSLARRLLVAVAVAAVVQGEAVEVEQGEPRVLLAQEGGPST